jgi:hypothetical protein
VAHAETRQKLKELIVAKEDGVSPKDVSRSPVIEVGRERDTNIASSAAASMTEFREVKSTADDLRDTSVNSSTAASMTEFREVKAPDVKVGLEVKSQLDKDRTHTNWLRSVQRRWRFS